MLASSGAIQEEALGFGEPVFVICDTADRSEEVASGAVLVMRILMVR